VYCRIAFTAFGVSAALACSMRATTPLTTGVAMLVPLSVMYGKAERPAPPTRSSGLRAASRLPSSFSETMRVPGATTSGLAAKSKAVGPRELYPATRSSPVSGVPMWL
jgi:hypothetical protein